MPDTLHTRLVASLNARLERARAALEVEPFYTISTADGEPATKADASPLILHLGEHFPATEIRRVEALLRVVERHTPVLELKAVRPYCAAHLAPAWGDRPDWPCDDIRDLAVGEGIEVGG